MGRRTLRLPCGSIEVLLNFCPKKLENPSSPCLNKLEAHPRRRPNNVHIFNSLHRAQQGALTCVFCLASASSIPTVVS